MRERVLKRLKGLSDEILAVSACQVATLELMERVGVHWPEGLKKAERMAKLARAGHDLMGFESVRVPFDRMVEVEALGVRIKYPEGPFFPEVEKTVERLNLPDTIVGRGRTSEVLRAIELLSEGEEAVFAGMLGPFSIACHSLGIMKVVKDTVKRREGLAELLSSLASLLAEYGRAMAKAGADVIVIEEEFGQMVSPGFFKEVLVPSLKKIVGGVGLPVILHMCGDITMLAKYVPEIGVAGLSIDHRPEVPRDINVIGNIDTYGVLVAGGPKDVERAVRRAVERGIGLVSPGGPLLPQTPMENVLALTKAAERLNRERG